MVLLSQWYKKGKRTRKVLPLLPDTPSQSNIQSAQVSWISSSMFLYIYQKTYNNFCRYQAVFPHLQNKNNVCSSRVPLQLLDEVQRLPCIYYLIPETDGNQNQYWRDNTNEVGVTQCSLFSCLHILTNFPSPQTCHWAKPKSGFDEELKASMATTSIFICTN